MASSNKKVIFAALIGNSLIAATKFVAGFLTGSSAMLSEGIHSLVDTGNQGVLLYGLKRAKRPPDAEFPFGHGKEIYFWSFVVAISIFAIGAGVSLYEGVHRILHPSPIANPYINYIVLGFALLFEGGAWLFAWKEFSRSKGKQSYFKAVRDGKDPTLFVVLFEDSAAMLGLIVAFVGILLAQLTNIPQFDGIASVVIGIILAATAIWLAYETKSLLIGESALPEVVADIRHTIGAMPEVEHVNEVLSMHMGPEYILLNISVDFKQELTSDDVESAVAMMTSAVKAKFPKIKRVFIEGEARRSI